MVSEKITIITEMKDLVTGASKKINQSIEDMGYGMQKATTNISKTNKGLTTQTQTITKTTKGLKKFKFEWLGVMFAGMAIVRIFGGIIKKQAQLWGISEGLTALWTIVMIPVMEVLSNLFWKIFDIITSLPESVQAMIGWFVVFAAAIGVILLVVGQFMLALNSFIMLAPTLGVWIGKLAVLWKGFGAMIAGIGAPIWAIIAIIVAVVVGMYLAWKSNFLGMKKTVKDFIAGVKQFFSGIIEVVKGIMMIVKGIFTGDFTIVKDGIIKIFKGLWDVLIGGFKTVGSAIVAILTGALLIIYNVIKVIIDAIGWLGGQFGRLFGGSGEPLWEMPSMQTGGVVQETGPHLLHKGETVTPAGSSGGNVFNVSVNASVSSDYDVRRLAEELSSELAVNFERKLKMRGSI